MLATELEKHEYTAVPGTCGRLAGASAPERVEAPGRQVAPIARQRGHAAQLRRVRQRQVVPKVGDGVVVRVHSLGDVPLLACGQEGHEAGESEGRE